MIRLLRLFCVLLALILCAGCSALPEPVSEAVPTAVPESPAPTPEPSPTPDPTPEPTAAPTPTPTPEPTPEPITEERLDSGEFDSCFDNALFLGDSITDMFAGYVRKCRQTDEDFLGGAQLFGATSMSVKFACQDRPSNGGISFRYRGRAVSITQHISESGADTVFILLGVNDLDCRTQESVEGYFAQLIDVIREKCPDVKIVMQGVLPVTERFCRSRKVGIERWNGFNKVLSGICEEHGAAFLDFSADLMDENGYLPGSLSSDKEYHLNDAGNAIWVRALRLYAAQQMYPDAEVLVPGA